MQKAESTGEGGRSGRKAFLAASFAAQFCALARYTLLARLLGPEQLGIAVALILTAQFFESLTDSGSDRFLVQDKDGDELEVQRLVHLVWIVRGALIAAALILLSHPIAAFFDTPELGAGLMLLAMAPLIAGFTNLDFRRVQRRSDFRGESRTLLASEISSLLVTALAAYFIRDYTAILYGLVTRSAVMVLVSHRVAKRGYTAGYSADHSVRLARFALPLMLNGLLLFLGNQGDRVLIGGELGVEALGFYSATLLLIYYPTGIITRYVSATNLPLVAAAKHERSALGIASERVGGDANLLSLLLSAGYALIGPTAIVLLFGPKFEQPSLIVALVGLLQTSRFIRLWPVTMALAQGGSGTVLISNLVRLSAFPAALVGLTLIGGLLGLLVAFTIAEFATLLITVVIVYRQSQQPLSVGLSRVAVFFASSAIIVGWAALAQFGASKTLIACQSLATLAVLAWLLRRESASLKEIVRLITLGLARRGRA